MQGIFASHSCMRCLTISIFCDTFSHDFCMNYHSTPYRIVFLSSLLWCASILIAPIALSWGAATFSGFIYSFYSHACHQIDSHSLHVLDEKLAVCARCASIYFGFFLCTALYPLLQRQKRLALPKRVVFVPISLLLLDVILNSLGIHESTLFSRVFTGLLVGGSLPFLILPPAEEAFNELLPRFRFQLRRNIRHAE
jgi:uncharacterized membrane protein